MRCNDKRTVAILVARLKGCSNSRDLVTGKITHREAAERGLEDHTSVANTLVSMYSKCSCMFEAQKSFDKIQSPNVVSWNALILGYAENSQGETALECFFRMSCQPNHLTFLAALKACGSLAARQTGVAQPNVKTHVKSLLKLGSLEKTMIVHFRAAKVGFDSEIMVANSLIDTYSHCGSLLDARYVFDKMSCRTVVSWTVLILGYVENGEAGIAIRLFHAYVNQGWEPTARAFFGAVRACTSLAAEEDVHETGIKLTSLKLGTEVHRLAANAGCESDIFVTSGLIDMYSRCGDTAEARRIFDARRDYRCIVCRTSMILGYSDNGEGELALEVFDDMRREGCEADSRAYVAALKACVSLAACEQGQPVDGKSVKVRSLEKGMEIHAQASESGAASDLFVASSLVDVYSKCGSMRDASRVFYELMPRHSVVAWTSIILGYVENGEEEVALQLLESMHAVGCEPNALTFVAALKACTGFAVKEEGAQVDGALVKTGALGRGMDIHARCERLGIVHQETFVANALLDMYGKSGSMLDARSLFDRMCFHNVLSWNALMRGYGEAGEGDLALKLFSCMQGEGGFVPNALSFVAAIKACSHASLAEEADSTSIEGERQVKVKPLDMLRSFHAQAAERAFDRDVFLMNSLVDAYSKCGSLVEATRSFDAMSSSRTLVSWNTLILGYAGNGQGEAALDLFARMQSEGFVPDGRTYFAAFKACTSLAATNPDLALRRGSGIHSQASKSRCDSDVLVASTVVDMYVKCKSLVDARMVFDRMTARGVGSWSSLILGYAENGEEREALKLFEGMKSLGCSPNALAFVAALKACIGLAEKETETKVHDKVVRLTSLENVMAVHSSLFEDRLMVMNSLVDVYSKCGSLDDARRVFDRMKSHSLVTWNTLVLGYVENGEGELALDLFSLMQHVGLEPDARTYVAALKACSATVAAEAGRAVEAEVWRSGELESNAILESSLLDLYGRCGSMVRARQLFDVFQSRDLVVWNSLLVGYSRQGNAAEVFAMFQRMVLDEELRPDGISFVAVLTACNHAGLVGKGKDVFERMSRQYGVAPSMEHYHCMVDILGRADEVAEAVELVKSMKLESNPVTWGTVLASCKQWRNVEVAEMAFRELVRLDVRDGAAYVALASVYEKSEL